MISDAVLAVRSLGGVMMMALCAAAVHAQEAPAVPGIAGVLAAGTTIELVAEGFDGTEGPIPQPDGGLLFTENRASRIIRIAPDGATSVWMDPTGGANSLALLPDGRIVAALTERPAIGVLVSGGEPQLLAREYEGRTFSRPNDLTAGRLGQVYFTDPGGGTAAPGAPVAVYHLASGGALQRIATDIERLNGIVLSPDERTLYVANTGGEWVIAFALDERGQVTARRNFARLAGVQQVAGGGVSSGADGLAVDVTGRVYVASTAGVQVFSPQGEALGIIALPKAPQNLAFAGADRTTLYVVGRGSVYRLATLTRGPDRLGK